MVSTPLKNISQIGNLPQVGVKIKNVWNHHLVINIDTCNQDREHPQWHVAKTNAKTPKIPAWQRVFFRGPSINHTWSESQFVVLPPLKNPTSNQHGRMAKWALFVTSYFRRLVITPYASGWQNHQWKPIYLRPHMQVLCHSTCNDRHLGPSIVVKPSASKKQNRKKNRNALL